MRYDVGASVVTHSVYTTSYVRISMYVYLCTTFVIIIHY